MKKNGVTLILFVVLLGVIYLGIKAYVYFSTQSEVDDMVKQASLFADVQYQGISSDLLDGSVSVDGISITPRSINDVISIKEFKMQGDGIGFLFGDKFAVDRNAPQKRRVLMKGLSVTLDGEIMRSMNDLSKQAMRERSGHVPGACDFGGSLAPGDLRALGYDDFSLDMLMSIHHDKKSEALSFELQADVENIASMNMTAKMKGAASPMMAAMQPRLEEIKFSFSADGTYMKSVKRYCGKVTKLGEQGYLDSMINASDEDYLRYYQFVPGPGIREAIRNFMTAPGDVEISLSPEGEIDPNVMNQYAIEDLPEALGLQVSVNGKPVTDLSIQMADASQSEENAGEGEAQEPRVTYEFQDTPMKRLPAYIGARVIIDLDDGNQRKGRLISIDAKDLSVEQRIHNGKLAVTVSRFKIKRVQVHRRVVVEATE